MVYRTAFEDAQQDKHGISISHVENGLDFGVVEPSDAEQGYMGLTMKVHLSTPTTHVWLQEIKLSSKSTTSP